MRCDDLWCRASIEGVLSLRKTVCCRRFCRSHCASIGHSKRVPAPLLAVMTCLALKYTWPSATASQLSAVKRHECLRQVFARRDRGIAALLSAQRTGLLFLMLTHCLLTVIAIVYNITPLCFVREGATRAMTVALASC